MNITVDNREGKRIKYAKNVFEEPKYTLTVKEIPTRDFIFNDNVVFEYKKLADFYKSSLDGRIYRQTRRCCKEFRFPFLIIE